MIYVSIQVRRSNIRYILQDQPNVNPCTLDMKRKSYSYYLLLFCSSLIASNCTMTFSTVLNGYSFSTYLSTHICATCLMYSDLVITSFFYFFENNSLIVCTLKPHATHVIAEVHIPTKITTIARKHIVAQRLQPHPVKFKYFTYFSFHCYVF